MCFEPSHLSECDWHVVQASLEEGETQGNQLTKHRQKCEEAEQAFLTAAQVEGQEASDELGLQGAPPGIGAKGLIRCAIMLQEAAGAAKRRK